MVTINGYDIELTRGDTLFLRVDLSGRDLPEGTDAIFTVKKNVRSDEVILRKRFDASDEVLGIRLSSRETRLEPGVYVWDVRLQIPQEDGSVEVYTPMEYAAFVVLESVGEPVDEDDADVTVDVQLVIKEARTAIEQANAAAAMPKQRLKLRCRTAFLPIGRLLCTMPPALCAIRRMNAAHRAYALRCARICTFTTMTITMPISWARLLQQ